ncbi:MAG: hypothetical protein A3E07_01310 [Candidatus Wildermuthbacteria bacterium RIFCSPHIGHO2_12_FULL_45_9]|uniref:Response regulatory domain-containing protein n=1 Tax=Candidatus Wildermuthbacteria bacterium RIFCSPHIGHO2_02_FULL_45_25 TaxID=1802450 RepID=A0A1G2R3Z5_9BACT|nr:MAG: hypothetical protein A3C04_02805 [Candidatus Wildermuthbacteria bacterium RIFCSPHIGHO2_02_FULL_45_25]OHA71562.1 MAG: hypothetical protein A3E07_01310 [Candidatus Wildermuthbacteria bacterium RIFCSPHIGHO2_12_FULL_45_9]
MYWFRNSKKLTTSQWREKIYNMKGPAPKKILIVEDEDLLIEMYEDVFERAGFEVFLATTPQEALEQTKRARPDLILLDILLPQESGITFLKLKQDVPELASIPVLAFSNFDDPAMKAQARQYGAEDYLIKTNYTPEELLARVRQYIHTE